MIKLRVAAAAMGKRQSGWALEDPTRNIISYFVFPLQLRVVSNFFEMFITYQ